MAWLRIDDAFTEHPKFGGWSPAERWDWLALLCYCARYRTNGWLPSDAKLYPVLHSGRRDRQRENARKLVAKAIASGLADDTPEGVRVHDWETYNPADPTAAKRMRDYRARNEARNADRNEDRNADRNETVTRARARARGPVPSPEREINLSLTRVTVDADDEDRRRQAWVDRSHEPDVRSPGAFARAGIDSGEWPDPFAAPDEPRAVNGPVTVETCPECDCSPPYHAAGCSYDRS